MRATLQQVKNNFPTIIVIFFCLAARLSLLLIVRPWDPAVENGIILQSDAKHLHSIALSLMTKHQFAPVESVRPNAYRTPAYPIFLAAIYLIVGVKPWVAILVQIVLDTLSCLLVVLSIRYMFGDRAGLIGGLFYAVEPTLLWLSMSLLSETLFLFFLSAALWYLVHYLKEEDEHHRLVYLGWGGLMIGLSALTRAISLYLPIVLCMFLLTTGRRNLVHGIVRCLVFGGVFFIAIAPWIVRNMINTGTMAFSTASDNSLLILHVGRMESNRKGIDNAAETALLLAEADSMMIRDGFDKQQVDWFIRANYRRQLAMQYIRNYPFEYAGVYVRGVLNTFANLGTQPYGLLLGWRETGYQSNILNTKGLVATIDKFFLIKSTNEIVLGGTIALFLLTFYISLLAGGIGLWGTRRSILLILLCVSFYFILLAGPAGQMRFKAPALPFFLPIVAVGADRIIGKWVSWTAVSQNRPG